VRISLKQNSITSPKGFLANAVSAGLKKHNKLDLALIYSEKPAVAAGVFTQNRVKAAPVIISKKRLKKNIAQAIIVNSGNANCCLGKKGIFAAQAMADSAAGLLNMESEHVLVASTGTIGKPFPVEKVINAAAGLVKGLSVKKGHDLARAIMTTDVISKEASIRFRIKKAVVTIGAAAKGAGMIHPKLEGSPKYATMLVFITTDVNIKAELLKKSLIDAATETFNTISIDGDMSTNDTVFVLANGLAGNKVIDKTGKSYGLFYKALCAVTSELSRLIVQDGEGATKFIEIKIDGAPGKKDARLIAARLATSNLLKTAFFGEDPNWGRIAAGCGSAGVKFNADRLDIYIGNKKVMEDGVSAGIDRKAIEKIFKKDKIKIRVDLKSGKGSAKYWTSDLSLEYVKINASYST